MGKSSFNCSITAKISASEAIKRIGKVPEWWGISFDGNSEKQNDKFVVKMGGDSFFDFTVTELIPDKRVAWLVTDCNMPWYSDKKEWANTKLIFDLSENNGVTTLNFTHEGLTPDVECYKDCETGWSHWIRVSLLSYFTIGKGQYKKKIHKAYTTGIEVPFSAKIVFDHINDVAKWWPEEFDGKSNKLNDEFVLKTGDVHYSKQRIVEFVPNEKVVWLIIDSLRKTDNYSWTDTKMIFQLTPKDNNTAVSFTYDGPVLENEVERLAQVCDAVIKENLYNFITKNKTN
ncbi:MAG: SRPBCC domain-containing protein [Bacteroidetes bacterium]|nr:SRPBCC domain-containing protein [Bacteroidota bacterium]